MRSDLSCPAKAGHPVKADVAYITNVLRYWIAGSSRAMTKE